MYEKNYMLSHVFTDFITHYLINPLALLLEGFFCYIIFIDHKLL